MAEEEKKEEQPFQFVPEGGEPTNSSKDFTGKATATYPNGEIYEGLYLNGVKYVANLDKVGKRQIHLFER
jgi:hypothetical protein